MVDRNLYCEIAFSRGYAIGLQIHKRRFHKIDYALDGRSTADGQDLTGGARNYWFAPINALSGHRLVPHSAFNSNAEVQRLISSG